MPALFLVWYNYRKKVATLIPPRTLVPTYTKVYPLVCPLGKVENISPFSLLLMSVPVSPPLPPLSLLSFFPLSPSLPLSPSTPLPPSPPPPPPPSLQGAVLVLLDMLKHTVGSLTQEDTRTLAPQLGDLFTTCLNHRAKQEKVGV